MNELKETMIKKAMQTHQMIRPCGACADLNDCFTVEQDMLYFWFNTTDKSTHLMTLNLKKAG